MDYRYAVVIVTAIRYIRVNLSFLPPYLLLAALPHLSYFPHLSQLPNLSHLGRILLTGVGRTVQQCLLIYLLFSDLLLFEQSESVLQRVLGK